MKKYIVRFLYWVGLKKRPYGFKVHKYPAFQVGVDPFGKEGDDPLQGFAMIIPKKAVKIEEEKEDPRGVPIYAKCPANGGLCACTGACHKIIGWSQDPEKLAAHREWIKRVNEFRSGGFRDFYIDWYEKPTNL